MPRPNLAVREPRWWLIPLRVVVITFLCTLCAFALSLLLGIVTTAVAAWLRGVPPDLTIAYRHIAIPASAGLGVVVLASMTVLEIRRYQQARLLARIERLG